MPRAWALEPMLSTAPGLPGAAARARPGDNNAANRKTARIGPTVASGTYRNPKQNRRTPKSTSFPYWGRPSPPLPFGAREQRLSAGAGKDGLDARQERARQEGLGQVLVCAGIVAVHLILGEVFDGQHEHGQAPEL